MPSCDCSANTGWMRLRPRPSNVIPSERGGEGGSGVEARDLARAFLFTPRLTFVLLLIAPLVGCETGTADQDTTGPLISRTATSSPNPTPTPYVRPGLTPARVTRVVDGDTIRVEVDGEEFRVRYIGIDTPETVDPRRPVQCFGQEASERNRQLVEGKVVGLEKDVSETDDFDRLLRYVWVEDTSVNAALVEEGFALANTYPPDVRYADLFVSLQTQARENSRGLWGEVCAGFKPAVPQ
jgi:micrococcal nuclease